MRQKYLPVASAWLRAWQLTILPLQTALDADQSKTMNGIVHCSYFVLEGLIIFLLWVEAEK